MMGTEVCKQEVQEEKGRSHKGCTETRVRARGGKAHAETERSQGLVGLGPRESKEDREGEGGPQELREAEGQQELSPSLSGCLGARPGSASPKPLLKLLRVGARKARRKAAKLEGSRGPAAGQACTQEGGSGTRRQCPGPWPP